MWDDSLFNPNAEALKYRLVTNPDPVDVKQHQRLRLLCLEALYKEIDLLKLKIQVRDQYIESLKSRLQRADEAACRGIWMMHRLIEQAGCEEVLSKIEQAHIDAHVAKQVEVDFSFAKAVGTE